MQFLLVQAGTRQTTSYVASCIIIVILIYSALDKMLDFNGFIYTLAQSLVIPAPLKSFTAYSVIGIELLLPLLLSFKRTRLVGLVLSIILFVAFLGYICLMMFYSPYLPCSCGGFMESLTWAEHLWLNAALSIIAFIGYWFE